jgi:class 3 adenylate cyclase
MRLPALYALPLRTNLRHHKADVPETSQPSGASTMDFYEVVGQVLALLQRQGRVSYRALKRQFSIDDDYIEDLKEELLYAHESVVQADERGFRWIGDTEDVQVTTIRQADQAEAQPTAQEEPSTQVASPPPEQHIPDAEYRQLTILFTDLVDSTKLSGQLDAEDYRELVRAYQATCAEVIERFDCNLVQTLGDGLLIYSGYPVAHENDAERAVRVGLGILDAMHSLNERLAQDKGIHLSIRIGIHTGPVVVGEVGAGSRQEQLALGEVPNVAARLQGLAEPDTVVISDTTYRLIQGYFDCLELGEQSLRGVAEPMIVYQVLSESGVHSRLDAASIRGLTPLVGREQEIGLLLDRWNQVKDGMGQVVLLSGEAGIGKSRIAEVLKDHVTNEPHTRLECRNSPYFTNSALYPIIDMVQRTLRFQTDDTPETKLEKLEHNLSQYRLPTHETVPLFATLLSIPVSEDRYPPLNLSPQRQRQKTLESIVAIIVELAERQPLLFILDDAHWTDPSTLEVLDLLIDQTPTAQILTLITYRPEFQPTWGNRSYLTQLTLHRLSRNNVGQMVERITGGKSLPPEVVQQIVEKTDAVPLYVEECTKAVLESGSLKEVDGHYELVGTSVSLSIPSTLQDSLMSRLDRLVTAKAVAQYASVIGRQFSYELLHAVSQLDETTLQRELGRLVEAELVYQRGLPPQANYLFKHSLVQSTAYNSLLRSTRQGYHRRIAEVLKAQFPETAENQPELLAHHFTQAGLNEQAVGYWQQAGEKAVQRSAHLEGIAHLTHGLELLKMLPSALEWNQRELAFHLTLALAFHAREGQASDQCCRSRSLFAPRPLRSPKSTSQIPRTPRRHQPRQIMAKSGEAPGSL